MVTIIKNFFTEFTREGEQHPVTSVTEIADNYFKTNFVYDFIPIIPCELLFGSLGPYARLLYILKVIRIKKGFEVFNVH